MTKINDGKSLETLLGKSVKNYGFNRSSNHSFPLADRTQFLANQGGRGILWECKEVEKDYFQLTDMTQNERDSLRSITRSHGLGVIIFQHHIKSKTARYFGVWWQDWKALENQLGFIEDKDLPQGVRRKPGTARVYLTDGRRPPCLHMVPERDRGRLDVSRFVRPLNFTCCCDEQARLDDFCIDCGFYVCEECREAHRCKASSCIHCPVCCANSEAEMARRMVNR